MTSFGAPIATTRAPRERRHPLAGNGPIVDRARQALRLIAEAFGPIVASSHTEGAVETADGITLTLSYDPGNYVFSRVYGMTIFAPLPASSGAPTGLVLKHRGPQLGGTFVADRGASPRSTSVAALNAAVAPHLATIDMVRASITHSPGDGRTLMLSPMGGAFVWVLIPPVFKATAFPGGEPERILNLIRTVRDLPPAPHPSAQ